MAQQLLPRLPTRRRSLMGHLDNVTTIPRTAVVALLDELEAKGRTVSIHWSPPADVPTAEGKLDAARIDALRKQGLKGGGHGYAAKLGR
jgi:hypothetical protein